MKKILFLLSFVVMAVMAKSQDYQIPNDTLIWRDPRPLIFTDFLGEPIESSNLMGEAFCLILTSFEKHLDSTYVTISVQAVFDKTNSWISRRAKPEEMLLFQVTFNMFEVYARKLRKDADDLRVDPFAQSVFQRKYSSSLPSLTFKCNELKRDTKMGSDKNKLLLWDEKVKKELKDLERYKQ